MDWKLKALSPLEFLNLPCTSEGGGGPVSIQFNFFQAMHASFPGYG